MQFLLPALRSISIQMELNSLSAAQSDGTSSEVSLPGGVSVKLVEAEECVPVEHALVTFTTGSTGFPKLMLRKHRYDT